MTDTFETTLANITSQTSVFESSEEKAVEMFVVLPMLKQVGWNTENVSEIYPQRGLPDGGKVNFDLQIDGESRILIEVKRWSHDLNDEDEKQLQEYCHSSKSNRPKLAVLTSGRVWRLYLAPTAARGENSVLKRFDEVDVIASEPTEVENTFSQFIARDSMVDLRPTLNAAKDLYRKLQDYQEQKKSLTKAWNELATDRNKLVELVLEFAESQDIQTNRDNVMRFLDSLLGPLVNEVPTKPLPPPHSFVLPASPTSKSKKKHPIIGMSKGWNNLLLVICELMENRHPEEFHEGVLSVPSRFSETRGSKDDIQVSDEGIFAKWGGSREIREDCYKLVTIFG